MSDSFVTLLTLARQVPLSMVFPRQEYWSGLSFPSPRDPANPGIKRASLALGGRLFTTEPPGKPQTKYTYVYVCVCMYIYIYKL